MFQMGGLGPMSGEAEHFLSDALPPVPRAINRYTQESARLYGVLNKRLSDRECLAGEYSIAEIAIYPWVARHARQRIDLAAYPAVRRWFEKVGSRRGMAVPE